jgi:UDP-N-acetylglucosamine 2-epimerase (non-hydrolysing)
MTRWRNFPRKRTLPILGTHRAFPLNWVSVKRILFVFGTRPEAIKLCPVIRRVRERDSGLEAFACVTAQHRSMLDQVLDCFELRPDYDLNLMTSGQTLAETTSRVLASLDPILAAQRFDMAVVQGDTTTTMAGAMAAFYRGIPVAHVEAGLRTRDLAAPFPEEMNRVLTARLASLHFAPTEGSRQNLLAEGAPDDRIFVTGNTGIDAVLYVARALQRGALAVPTWEGFDPEKKLIVVTAHRRESFGDGIDQICRALAALAQRDDVQIVYPVHRNPNVLGPVTSRLGALSNVRLVEPLDYPRFVDLMRRAYLIVTDSGGIQEEAPSLGKPVLVMRDSTERPEAVAAGTIKLVGADAAKIVREAERLLEDSAEYERMSRIHNPYGDGRASERIIAAIATELGVGALVSAGTAR